MMFRLKVINCQTAYEYASETVEFIFSSIKVEPILLQNKMVYHNMMSYTEVHNLIASN